MSERIEKRLRDDLRAVESAALPPRAAVDGLVARAERKIARRRRGMAVSGVLAVTVLAGAVVWNTASAPSQRITAADSVPLPTTADTSGSTESTEAVYEGPWEAIRPGPLQRGATVVWTGSEGMMIGGAFENGAWAGIDAYDPATCTWRFVTGDPIEGDPIVFWSGTDIFVVATGDRMVKGYDTSGEVTFMQQTNNTDAVNATVPWAWTGTELLVWPSDVEVLPAQRPRAFNPLNGEWRTLAEIPLAARTNAASVWTGTEWIVWGGNRGTKSFNDGAAYNPITDTWRALADSPLSARSAPAVWTGTEMLVVAGSSGEPSSPSALDNGAAYDPASDTWRETAPGPAHPGFKPVWTGELLILFAKGGAVWYNPETDQWATGDFVWGEVPHESTSPVWTGELVLLLGSFGSPDSGGAEFRPPKT